MSKREDFSYFKLSNALGNTVTLVGTSTTGPAIDTQGYDSLTFHVHMLQCSTAVDPTVSYWYVHVQHTDASALGAGPSDYANVGSIDLIREASGVVSGGTIAINASTYSGSIMRIGYRGNKRYVRVLLSTVGAMAATTSGGIFIEAMLGHAHNWPVTVGYLDD